MARIKQAAVESVDRAMDVLAGLLDAAGDRGGHGRGVAGASDRVASGLSRVSGSPRSRASVTAAHERALALWVGTGERDRELDGLMWLAEHHSSQDARVRYGRQAEERARATGDLLRVVRALRARGRGLATAPDTRDEGVAVLMAAARSAREELDVTGEASDRARWTNLVLSCGDPPSTP